MYVAVDNIEIFNNRYKTHGGTTNLLSFQSKEVYDYLKENRIYNANLAKSREKRDYRLDIEQMGGNTPVWAFSPNKYYSEFNNRFYEKEFTNGNYFNKFADEMSLDNIKDMNKFILFELEVPSKLIRVGITHNGYPGAVVIPYIDREWVKAIYKVLYSDKNRCQFPYVRVLRRFTEDCLFKDSFLCHDTDRLAHLKKMYNF